MSQTEAEEPSEDALDGEEQDSDSGNFSEDDEHEDWEGMSDGDGDGDGQPLNGIGIRTGTVPRKPPTGEELRKIKDAADLYMSNSFKLKVLLKCMIKLAINSLDICPYTRSTHFYQRLGRNTLDLPRSKDSSILYTLFSRPCQKLRRSIL